MTKSVLASLLILSLAGSLWGQEAASFKSCEVNADGSITLRYKDTGAHKVEANVTNVAAPLAMVEKDGVWSVTTPPQKPETYWYRFIVDGKSELDPLNGSVLANLVFLYSSVTVPGGAPQLWDEMDVPHGVVHHHFYTSKVVKGLPGGYSSYYVYTPPGYDPRAAKPYPALYLLHGFSDTEAAWSTIGKANMILDNLIARGKASPMVIVMPLSYGDMDIFTKGYDAEAVRSARLFDRALVTEILPEVESQYRISRNRDDRAIAGLSMGGFESLEIGLGHPDLFAWIGSFSGSARFLQGPVERGAFDGKQANLRLLWIACGDQDGGLSANRRLIASLKARDFAVTPIETPGMHTWIVWHDNLIHFAPLLFQDR